MLHHSPSLVPTTAIVPSILAQVSIRRAPALPEDAM